MGYRAGVDLGTTFTAAAVLRDGEARPEVVTLGTRAAAIPTVVFVDASGAVLVGDAAEARAATDPSRVAREFKRRLGDPTPILLGGSPWSPEALLAEVLRHVVDRITAQEGGAPHSLTLTYPANWGPYKVEQFRQVPALAHLPCATNFATEPDAAAAHYASSARTPPGSVVAVYDLGGGTFDATVLRVGDDGPRVLGTPEGIDRLGGVDVDAAVLAHVRANTPHLFDGLDADDPLVQSALVELRDDCRRAKEALSEDTQATVTVALPTGMSQVRVTRGELEAAITPQVMQTVAALQRALGSAGVTPDQVHSVLLVGGASRMPLVAQSLSAALGRPTAVDANPKHATSLGAALGPMATPVASASPPEQPPAAAAATAPATPAAPAPRATDERTPTAATDRPRRRRPGLVVAGAAVVLALVAGGAYVLLGRDDGAAPTSVETVAGTGEAGDGGDHDPAIDAQLDGPSGIAFDADGRLLIADRANHRIRALLPDGTITPVIDTVGVTLSIGDGVAIEEQDLADPTTVTAHGDGRIAFVDGGCYVGEAVDDATGILAGTFPDEDFVCVGSPPESPSGLAALEDGRTLIGDLTTGQLWVADPETLELAPFDERPFPDPTAIAVDADGRILVAVDFGTRIVALDTDGAVRTVAGLGNTPEETGLGDGGPATDATLSFVTAIAVHPDGRILLADTDDHRIRAIATDGTISTLAGTGTAGYNGDGLEPARTQLNRPEGVAVDGDGRIYVADTGNNRIRLVG